MWISRVIAASRHLARLDLATWIHTSQLGVAFFYERKKERERVSEGALSRWSHAVRQRWRVQSIGGRRVASGATQRLFAVERLNENRPHPFTPSGTPRYGLKSIPISFSFQFNAIFTAFSPHFLLTCIRFESFHIIININYVFTVFQWGIRRCYLAVLS